MICRCHYRAQAAAGVSELDLVEAADRCRAMAEEFIKEGILLTAALYHYENMLFLYYEETKEMEPVCFMEPLTPFLESWPQDGKVKHWAKMQHIYYHSEPKSIEQWQENRRPEHRRGRIARLREDKLWDYVYHHINIVREGLLTGDKYQSIALHEDILFSYFEEPKTMVNIREDYSRTSETINDWLAVDPESHFIPYPEAEGANFLIIPSYFAVG